MLDNRHGAFERSKNVERSGAAERRTQKFRTTDHAAGRGFAFYGALAVDAGADAGSDAVGVLADDAGDDTTFDADGTEGSDAGDDAGVTATGTDEIVAVGTEGAGSLGVVLLQPASVIASAARSVVRVICMGRASRVMDDADVPNCAAFVADAIHADAPLCAAPCHRTGPLSTTVGDSAQPHVSAV